MAITYKFTAVSLGRNYGLGGLLFSIGRKLAPLRGLIIIVFFHFIVSLGYITLFAWRFSFGRRLISLHLSIVISLVSLMILGLGGALLFRRFREWRWAKVLLSLVPAIWLSVLVILYFADYIGNKMWGSNVTYELAMQYVFWGGIFQKELQLLSGKVYLTLAISLVFIFTVHLVLSTALFNSLEELYLQGRELSMFRDRRRALASGVSILLGAFLLGLSGFLSARVEARHRDRLLSHEPILGLFINSRGLDDFVSYSTYMRLEAEERRNRATYPSGQSFKKKNVVFILLDSLRADHMQVYGYERPTTPFLTSLFKTGRLKKVKMATSTCADTNCGISTTLTSKPIEKYVPQSFKLHELLYDQGYKVYFILSGSHRRWYGLDDAYGKSFTYFFDGTKSTKYNWNDDRVIFEGLEQAPDLGAAPGFFYFHLMSTHLAGVRQEQYNKYLPAKVWTAFSEGSADPVATTNYYDDGVIQADATIKNIFETLDRKGYLANSVVVILADHGEGLGRPDHDIYGHVKYLYQECIRIPLLIYDTEAEYANLEYATQIDVAPTVLDRLGLKIPPSWQGRSLLDPEIRQYSFHRTRLHPTSYAVIYRTDRAIYKYLRHPDQKEELFELVSDPREKLNIVNTADPAVVEHLRSKLAAKISGGESDYPAEGR